MPDEAQYLKIPCTLTKITSKKGQDHELMWQITLETHSSNADQVQTLIPCVDQSFVMVLVKVESREEVKEAMDDDGGISLGEPEKKIAKKKGKKRK
jgi:hypothetical protein